MPGKHTNDVAPPFPDVTARASGSCAAYPIGRAGTGDRADFFSRAIEDSAQPFAARTPGGRLLFFNRAFAKLIGYAEEELRSGTCALDLTPPQWRDHEAKVLGELHRSGEPQLYQKEYVRKDGTRIPVEVNVHLARDERGQPDYYYAFITDITERMRAQEALRQSEGRFRAVLENLPVGVFVAEASGDLIHANPMALEIWGQTPMLPMSHYGQYKAWWPDTGRRLSSDDWALTKALKHGQTIRDEILNIEAFDGVAKVIRNFATPVRGHGGENYGGISVLQDITQHQRAAEAVRQSEQRMRQMADAMPQIVWITRPDGYHEYYNRKWYEFTGVAEGSTDGEGWNALFHPQDQARAWAAWRLSLDTGQPYQIEYRLRRHDGQYRWFLGRALPARDPAGRTTQWFGTCTDIHDAKLTEEELARARDAAEQASRAKDRFLAVLSHELRTPLSPVLLAAASLERDQDLRPEVCEELSMIRRNVELEARLIDDLLDLSRVLNGKLRADQRPVAVHQVIRLAMGTCEQQMRCKGIRQTVQLWADRDTVMGDAARLQQVFWNLLSNAIKFTPERGEVTVRSEVVGQGTLRLIVRDTGAGIPPEALSRIFDAFEQVDSDANRRHGGMGLGLAICKGIVALHGGTIEAHSDGVGAGATFRIELPLAAGPNTATAEPPSDATPARPGQPLRLLVVEDHADTARVLSRLLERGGHRVRTAGSAAEAMELAASESYDLVVSDIGLPDATGYHLMRDLRERYGLTGLAMTGYGMEEDLQKGREAGFAEYLVKPVNVTLLEQAIRRVAEQLPGRGGTVDRPCPP